MLRYRFSFHVIDQVGLFFLTGERYKSIDLPSTQRHVSEQNQYTTFLPSMFLLTILNLTYSKRTLLQHLFLN